MFFSALVCFVLAVAIGSWRQMSGVYEKHLSYNCPPAWRNPIIRIITWLLSTSLSVLFAYALLLSLMISIDDGFGKFVFCLFLFIRLLTSAYFGAYRALKRCEEIARKYTIDNLNYDAMADDLLRKQREDGNEEITKDEIIILMKETAEKFKNNNFDDFERQALNELKKRFKNR